MSEYTSFLESCLAAASAGDVDVHQYVDTVPPLASDTDGYATEHCDNRDCGTDGDPPYTTEHCDNGDYSADVKQEILEEIKQEPDDVILHYIIYG